MIPFKGQPLCTPADGAAISDVKASSAEDFLLAVLLDKEAPLAFNLMLLEIGCVGYTGHSYSKVRAR